MEQTKTEEVKPSNNKKKKLGLVVLGVIVLVGAVTLFFYLRYKATHITTDDAFIDGNIHTIASRVKGSVKNNYVKSNQFVKKGDVLVENLYQKYPGIKTKPIPPIEDEDFTIEIDVPPSLLLEEVETGCHKECISLEDKYNVYILPLVVQRRTEKG